MTDERESMEEREMPEALIRGPVFHPTPVRRIFSMLH
jgi:hypothetical protein